jgi:hypothetical protein
MTRIWARLDELPGTGGVKCQFRLKDNYMPTPHRLPSRYSATFVPMEDTKEWYKCQGRREDGEEEV